MIAARFVYWKRQEFKMDFENVESYKDDGEERDLFEGNLF
jgi:hypothetical protein